MRAYAPNFPWNFARLRSTVILRDRNGRRRTRPNRPRVRQDLNYDGDAPHLLHQMHRTELRGPTNRARLTRHAERGTPRWTRRAAAQGRRENYASRRNGRESAKRSSRVLSKKKILISLSFINWRRRLKKWKITKEKYVIFHFHMEHWKLARSRDKFA